MEYIKKDFLPNVTLLEKFLAASNERYSHLPNTEETRKLMADFLNARVDEAITAGDWRTRFILPDGREIKYLRIEVSEIPLNPEQVNIIPTFEEVPLD